MLTRILQAVRVWAGRPGLTALAVLSLAPGIGAIAVVFSMVDGVLLRPLPYEDSERLISIWEQNPEKGMDKNTASAANFLDWKEQSTSFTGMAAYRENPVGVVLTGSGEPERLAAGLTSADYFRVLGVKPAAGRTFAPEEDWRGSAPVVILSHDLWQRRFAAQPDILGKGLVLNGVSTTVIGIAPAGFRHLPGQVDLWLTPSWDPGIRQSVQGRRAHNLRVVGRLKPGVSSERAAAELQTIARRLEELYPETNRSMGTGITPLHEWVIGDVRTPLIVLLFAVGFVLLIACANIANLLLVRAASRAPEMALRSALGASRAQLIGQSLTESLVLAVFGGLVGVLLAYWGIHLVVPLAAEAVPRAADVTLDLRVLAFTLVTVLLTGVAFGLVPALGASRSSHLVLREQGTRSTGFRSARSRSLLVVLELALAVTLVISAGLLVKSFSSLIRVDPGFDTKGLLTAKISLPGTSYPGGTERESFYRELLVRLKGLPGVQSAAVVSSLPLTSEHWTSDITIEGRARDENEPSIRHLSVTPGYFQVMGIPLVAGRLFSDGDAVQAPRVAIVNESLVRKYFPAENPLGRKICEGAQPDQETVWWTIVGVVRDQKQERLSAETEPEIYRPFSQWSQHDPMTLLLRTATEPLSLVGTVRGAVRGIDPNLPIFQVRTMEQVLSESLTRSRFVTLLLATFAAIALIQAAVGLYAILGYTVGLRTQEIGIRMALGGRATDVLAMVLRQGMALVAIGLCIGLAMALGLTRYIASLLYDVNPVDPVTFVLVPAVLVAVGLLACYLPARRAARVDPLVSLRKMG